LDPVRASGNPVRNGGGKREQPVYHLAGAGQVVGRHRRVAAQGDKVSE
jgi:hypothetical protein